MAEELKWHYEKITEDGKIDTVYINRNDFDGKITGRIVFGVKEWFDENPEERKRLGWIKHIEHATKDVPYNHQSQYLVNNVRTVDAYTVEDDWKVLDKSEEMMRLQELSGGLAYAAGDGVFMFGGAFE